MTCRESSDSASGNAPSRGAIDNCTSEFPFWDSTRRKSSIVLQVSPMIKALQ